ncbi:MAG TPA: hypothetical protein VFG15_30195 [Amycolatopsis sp.]|nr:hypothetical protein [Amycolatopsis sp.]
MTEPRTITRAQAEANEALRTMRTAYLHSERARGVQYIGLASVSISDELVRRQAEFMSKRTVAEMIHDTDVWAGFAERTSDTDGFVMACEALSVLAVEQDRRCVADIATAADEAYAEYRYRDAVEQTASGVSDFLEIDHLAD